MNSWNEYGMRHTDEDRWEDFRQARMNVVEDLLEFLFKLRIIREGGPGFDPWHGLDISSYVDRHWKV